MVGVVVRTPMIQYFGLSIASVGEVQHMMLHALRVLVLLGQTPSSIMYVCTMRVCKLADGTKKTQKGCCTWHRRPWLHCVEHGVSSACPSNCCRLVICFYHEYPTPTECIKRVFGST